jgi:Ca2+-binding EF-hand superfamily protein
VQRWGRRLLKATIIQYLSPQLDEGTDLVAAFECFDEQDEGKIDAGELRYWLSEVGDRMKDEEVRGSERSVS